MKCFCTADLLKAAEIFSLPLDKTDFLCYTVLQLNISNALKGKKFVFGVFREPSVGARRQQGANAAPPRAGRMNRRGYQLYAAHSNPLRVLPLSRAALFDAIERALS